MHHPFKSTLIRRLFWVFLALSLVPTLLFVMVPSLLRIQSEQETLRQLQTTLSEKADTGFAKLVANKTQHFEQMLRSRENMLGLLAETLAPYLENLATTGHSDSALDTTHQMAEQIVQADSAIRCLYMFGSGLQWIVPENEKVTTLSPVEFEAMSSQLSEDAITEIRITDGLSILTAGIPIKYNGRVVGFVAMDLVLEEIVEEVPRHGLVPQASLVLISGKQQILAAPTWSRQTDWLGDPIPFDPASPSLINQEALHAVLDKRWKFDRSDPLVSHTEVNGSVYYSAFLPVEAHPIGVLLILPEHELYSYAISYGAPLHEMTLPIIVQALISGVGFLMVMGIGSAIALRILGEPLHQLTLGANMVAEGDFSYRIPNLGTGEIAEVADSFNMMVSAVESTQETLKQNQAELSHALSMRQKEFEIINQVTYLTNLATDLPQKLTSVLHIMQADLDVFASSIFVLNQNGEITTPVCQSEAPFPDFWHFVREEEEQLAKQSLTSPTSLVIQKPEHVAGCGEHYMAAVPICFRNRSSGVLMVHYTGDTTQSHMVQAFLPELATHIAILIENSRLQSQNRFLIIAEERRNLARELHDSVTQAVFSLSLVADGLKTELNGAPESTCEAVDFLIEQSLRVRKEMRQLINELRPFSLEGENLEDAFHNHISSLQRSAQVVVQKHIVGDTKRLQMPIQYNLDRIIQEALSNVARHARASKVCIDLCVSVDELMLTIHDDGIGFDLEHVRERHPEPFGLISMRERAEIMGGQFSIESSSSAGTCISVRVPLGNTIYTEMRK